MSLARTPTKTKTKTRNVKRKKKGRRNERRLSFKYSFCIPASLALQLSLKAGPDSYFQKKLDIALGSANDPRTFPTTTQLQNSLMLSIGLQQFIAKSIETCANIWTLKGCTAISPARNNFFHVGPPSLSGAHSLRAEATRMCWIDWRQIEGHYYKSNNFRDGTTELGESIQICRNSRAGEILSLKQRGESFALAAAKAPERASARIATI